MKAHFASGLAAMVLGALASFPAQAQTITWYFKGVVTHTNVSAQFPPVGTPVRGVIRFATERVRTLVPFLNNHVEWPGVISSFSLTSHPQYNGPLSLNSITIDNDAPTGGSSLFDGIKFWGWQGDRTLTVTLQQRGPNPNILRSIGIPRIPPPLSALDVAGFELSDIDFWGGGFGGRITYLSLRPYRLGPHKGVR